MTIYILARGKPRVKIGLPHFFLAATNNLAISPADFFREFRGVNLFIKYSQDSYWGMGPDAGEYML